MAYLQKWYFDFLTEEDVYVFVYFASLRFAGLAFRTVTVHLGLPAQGVFLTRALVIPRAKAALKEGSGYILRAGAAEIRTKDNGFALSLSASDCRLRLDYAAGRECKFDPVVIPTRGETSVVWKPLGLKYQVTGQVRIGSHVVEVRGANGYADYLEANCLPRAFPVRALYWGRLAHEEVELVYVRAESGAEGWEWSAMLGRAGDITIAANDVAIQPLAMKPANNLSSPPRRDYSVSAAHDAAHVQMNIHDSVPVQSGAFIDQQQHMSTLARWLLKLFTRNPQSTKWLSRADVAVKARSIDLNRRNIACIDEYVTF